MRDELEAWVEAHPVVRNWIDSVEPQTHDNYAYRFKAFYDWITEAGEFKGYTPEKLLDYQDQATGRRKVTIINALNSLCKRLSRELTPSTVQGYWSATRSFFAYHGCELPRRRFSLDENHKEAKPQDLDRKSMVMVLGAAKPRDRAIYTIATMAGMGFREFNIFNRSSEAVLEQLNGDADYVTVTLSDRKRLKGKRSGYFTLIMGDALDLLRRYVKLYGRPKAGEPIFKRRVPSHKNADPAIASRTYRKNFKTLCRRVGLDEGYSAHQVRDVLRTEWQRSGADPAVCEFIMGHDVDANDYLKFLKAPEYVVEQYRIALSRLNLVSNPEPDKVAKSEVEQLRNKVRRLEEARDERVNGLEAEIREMKAMLRAVYEDPDLVRRIKDRNKVTQE